MSKTIAIEVRLYASLRKRSPGVRIGEPLHVQIEADATLADLMRRLNVRDTDVQIAFVNSRRQEPEYRLVDGDRVALFPPVGGG